MGLFGNGFEKAPIDEKMKIERAEENVDILESDLKVKDWTEVWDTLCHTELAGASIVEKMSAEAKEKFKEVIVELKQVFAAEKDQLSQESSPDKDLVGDIENALNKL
jgi:hypothetical protein